MGFFFREVDEGEDDLDEEAERVADMRLRFSKRRRRGSVRIRRLLDPACGDVRGCADEVDVDADS